MLAGRTGSRSGIGRDWVQERGLYFARTWDTAYTPCSRRTIRVRRRSRAACSSHRSARERTSTPASASSASSRPACPAPFVSSPTCSRSAPSVRADVTHGCHVIRLWALVCLLTGCGSDGRTPVVLYSPHGRDQLVAAGARVRGGSGRTSTCGGSTWARRRSSTGCASSG